MLDHHPDTKDPKMGQIYPDIKGRKSGNSDLASEGIIRGPSIGLIQIRHAVYSHKVAWAPRPYSECARIQMELTPDAVSAGGIVLTVSNRELSYGAHFSTFCPRKICILYILLLVALAVLILPFEA